MCYFDMTLWSCGYWRWGHFRQQCNKEYRMGETCGLKLVYLTKGAAGVCKLCHDTEKKKRRYDKMARDVERWHREGNRRATIERTCGEMREVAGQIYNMRAEHYHRISTLGQGRDVLTRPHQPTKVMDLKKYPSHKRARRPKGACSAGRSDLLRVVDEMDQSSICRDREASC
ncbi:hypothetical protein MY11210_003741 [Beauveria gryllotalpidicola]